MVLESHCQDPKPFCESRLCRSEKVLSLENVAQLEELVSQQLAELFRLGRSATHGFTDRSTAVGHGDERRYVHCVAVYDGIRCYRGLAAGVEHTGYNALGQGCLY